MRIPRLNPPAAAFLLVALGAALHVLTPMEHRRILSCTPCGMALIVAAAGLIIWAWVSFWRHGTTIVPKRRPTALVVSGAYRFSRNPMYLGGSLTLLGIAFLVGSIPMLVPPIGYFLFANFVEIPDEEARLARTFGEAFDAYRRATRRWL